jgi:hypothetical protein
MFTPEIAEDLGPIQGSGFWPLVFGLGSLHSRFRFRPFSYGQANAEFTLNYRTGSGSDLAAALKAGWCLAQFILLVADSAKPLRRIS